MTGQRWYKSLRVLLALWLSIALLPLGLMAVLQTNRIAQDSEINANLALLSLTEQVAISEKSAVEQAFGAVRFLKTITPDLLDTPDLCAQIFSSFAQNSPSYNFVGFVPESGVMSCSSLGEVYDFERPFLLDEPGVAPVPPIVVDPAGQFSGGAVVIITEPLFDEGVFRGFVSVSVPHETLVPAVQADGTDGLIDVMTITYEGDIITSARGTDSVLLNRPADLDISLLQQRQTFEAISAAGERRTYAVIPVRGGPASIVGVWPLNAGDAMADNGLGQPAVFRILMWVCSLIVALLALHMLVLRHLTILCRAMDEFAATRSMSLHHDSHAAPNEIRALTDNFMRMGDDIVREEAGVENALRQKNILLKEVHHRVKNNLQMISSIMNMQMRQASSPETKSVLGRLQDRILSLALIHRDLHQSDTFGLVNVGTLITELVENAVDVVMPEGRGIDVTTDIDGLMVVTDQAVPLSLIAAEAITNAIKYTGATDDQTPWLKISLHREEDEGVFALSNSFHPGSAAGTTPERDSTGLGGTLINAFVTQLGGDVDITKNDTAYAMTIRFSVNDIVNDAPDY